MPRLKAPNLRVDISRLRLSLRRGAAAAEGDIHVPDLCASSVPFLQIRPSHSESGLRIVPAHIWVPVGGHNCAGLQRDLRHHRSAADRRKARLELGLGSEGVHVGRDDPSVRSRGGRAPAGLDRKVQKAEASRHRRASTQQDQGPAEAWAGSSIAAAVSRPRRQGDRSSDPQAARRSGERQSKPASSRPAPAPASLHG